MNCKIHFEDRSTTYRIVSSSVALIINVHLGLLRIPLISSNTTSTIFVHVAFCIESVYLLDYNVHTMIHKTMKIPLVWYYTSHGSSLPHNDTYFRYNFFASNFFHTPRSTSFSSSFSSSTPSNDSTKESSITSREVFPSFLLDLRLEQLHLACLSTSSKTARKKPWPVLFPAQFGNERMERRDGRNGRRSVDSLTAWRKRRRVRRWNKIAAG